jgi:hypothetical protein
MTIKADRHKPSNRPKKKDAERRRRLRVQKKRLLALGVPADQVAVMRVDKVRELLRRPAKLVKDLQKKAQG